MPPESPASSLPPELLALAKPRIALELEDRARVAGGQISQIASDYSMRGAFHSTMHLGSVRRFVEEEYRTRAMVALGVLRRAADMSGVRLTIETRGDVLAQLTDALEGGSAELDQAYRTKAGMLREDASRIDATLTGMKSKALEWAASELDHHIAASAIPPQAATASTSVNIHGPVGAVQTAPGAVATIHQSITPAELTPLLEALAAAAAAVTTASELTAERRDELLGLVATAKAEAAAAKPNVLTLRALGSGVATSIMTLGSAPEAYHLLKGALALIGVSLP